MANKSFKVRLQGLRELSDSTRDFRFVREDAAVTEYMPGQFFRFVFEDDAGEFERSYSLCNYSDLHSPNLDLVVSKVKQGRATRLLFAAKPGLTARVTGPFGRLVLPVELPPRLVLVATSVGLAPFLPMLKTLESLSPGKVLLLLGVRDRSEFIYGDLLLDYAQRNPYFDLRLCLSRESARHEWEQDGYVTAQVSAIAPDPAADHYLLCGNPAMIDDVFALLKERGFKARQVVREKYVFARESKKEKKTLTEAQRKLIAEKMNKYR